MGRRSRRIGLGDCEGRGAPIGTGLTAGETRYRGGGREGSVGTPPLFLWLTCARVQNHVRRSEPPQGTWQSVSTRLRTPTRAKPPFAAHSAAERRSPLHGKACRPRGESRRRPLGCAPRTWSRALVGSAPLGSGRFARERGEAQGTLGHPAVAGIVCGHWGQTSRTVVSHVLNPYNVL